MANLILNNDCKEYLQSAKYYSLAAKYYAIDNEFYKAGNCSKKAVDILIHNPKNEVKLSHYRHIMRYSVDAKNYFGNGGYYEESGKMFQIEMHYRMLIFLNYKSIVPNCSNKDIIKKVIKGIIYFFTEKFLGYGESILRILFTSISIIIIYALIYWKFCLLVCSKANYVLSFIDYFYYSIVTFTTLGYGDISPNLLYPMAKILSGSEAFLGAFVMAIIVLVVSRKLCRR